MPLRLTDHRGYVHRPGLSPNLILSRSLQIKPIQHRGVAVRSFFLRRGGVHESGRGTAELFASRASGQHPHGTGNGREAHLEALLATAPVDVAVFDARPGRADDGLDQGIVVGIPDAAHP